MLIIKMMNYHKWLHCAIEYIFLKGGLTKYWDLNGTKESNVAYEF